MAATYPETLPAGAREALGVTAEGTHFDTVLEGRKSHEEMGFHDGWGTVADQMVDYIKAGRVAN